MDLASQYSNETLGQTLIPVINKLQDLFSQVRTFLAVQMLKMVIPFLGARKDLQELFKRIYDVFLHFLLTGQPRCAAGPPSGGRRGQPEQREVECPRSSCKHFLQQPLS